tara:strand:- start:299 stop:679 length:381 start_codon:yes stop_codon:yes gene_type:complete
MITEKKAKKHHELMMMAQQLKALQNQTKLELGIVLDELQDFHEDMEDEGIDYFGTFISTLATLHLNMRRTVPLIRNSRYAIQTKIPVENYKYYDSGLLNEMRKKQKDPNEYLDDIKGGVSYNDFNL